jgi:hypothetical protein
MLLFNNHIFAAFFNRIENLFSFQKGNIKNHSKKLNKKIIYRVPLQPK